MPVSSGRSKIDYEKIDEEDRLKEFVEQLKGVPYDLSSAPSSDLAVPKDLLDSCVISQGSYIDHCGIQRPQRTIKVQAQISPVQYRGMTNEHIDFLISDVKRKLAESISESFAQHVRFHENMSYDGTITILAELDMDTF